MVEENKTNKELLEEVKKLREATEKENKQKQIERASSGLIWLGVSIILFACFAWLFIRGCMVLSG